MHRDLLLALTAGCVGCAACILSGDDVPPPRLGAITPGRAPVGASVTIDGDHFCPTPDRGSDDPDPLFCDGAGGVIRFGASTATASRWSGHEIDVTVPASPVGAVDVSLTVGGRSSNAVGFVVTP